MTLDGSIDGVLVEALSRSDISLLGIHLASCTAEGVHKGTLPFPLIKLLCDAKSAVLLWKNIPPQPKAKARSKQEGKLSLWHAAA